MRFFTTISLTQVRFASAALGLLFSLLGAQARAEGASGFDVNDVSILFPLTEHPTRPFYPDVRLLSKNIHSAKPLMSRGLFGEIVTRFMRVTGGSVGHSFTAPNYNPADIVRFRVVNFRYDPCFPLSSEDQKSCVQQIRLVVQPFIAEKSDGHGVSGGADDYSMHLLYQVGQGLPEQMDPVLQDLLALKQLTDQASLSNAGKALSVSPSLSRELKNYSPTSMGPIAEALKRLILSHISEEDLKEVTVVNGNDSDDQIGTWNFVGGVVRNGHWQITDIPRLPKTAQLQRTDFQGSFVNFKISDDGFSYDEKMQVMKGPKITNQASAEHAAPKSAELVRRLNDLEILQDPRKFNPRNLDCASCHLSNMSELYLKNLSSSSRQLGFENSYPVPFGITAFADPQTLPEIDKSTLFGNVHVIGYLSHHAFVTPMVAHSAASVAESLNQIMNLEAPTHRDCDLMVVKGCFLDPHETADHCLRSCQTRS